MVSFGDISSHLNKKRKQQEHQFSFVFYLNLILFLAINKINEA